MVRSFVVLFISFLVVVPTHSGKGGLRGADMNPSQEPPGTQSPESAEPLVDDVASFYQAEVEVKPGTNAKTATFFPLTLEQKEAEEDATCAAEGFTPGLCAMAALTKPQPADPSAEFNVYRPERLERALHAEIEAVLEGRHAVVSEGRFQEIQVELGAVFPALPKNANGALDHAVARYALFQRFLRQHGWYVRSLNPAGEAVAPSSTGEALRGRVPVHLLTLLETKLDGRGLGLRELAAVAATLEHLLRGDLGERLRAAWVAHHFHTNQTLKRFQAHKVLNALMVHYVSLEHRNGYALTEAQTDKELQDDERYTGSEMVQRFIRKALGRVPYDSPVTFSQAFEMAQEVNQEFEKFSVSECKKIEVTFLALPHAKESGWALLADFHLDVLNGHGNFAESTEYLHKAGVLEEGDKRGPRVLLPNYMLSPSNCLATTSFFDLCCPNECEALRQSLEEEIAAPSATPARVIGAVQRLSRSLSAQAAGHLEQAARRHGGSMPLHGLDFAEWLHGAFPHTCPRPRAQDFHSATDGKGEEEVEVPGAEEREFQAQAELNTFREITASREELELEQLQLKALASAASSTEGLTAGASALAALAKSFKGGGALADTDFVRPERLERDLWSEIEGVLAGSHAVVSAERVAEIEGQLKGMFMALPKNEHGGLDHAAARYALFQRFSRRRGWYIRSLIPVGEAEIPEPIGESLRAHMPVHLLKLVEKKQEGRGLGLRELVAVVATLEHLISSDRDQRLKAAYYAHSLLPNATLTESQANAVMKTLMAHFLSLETRDGYAITPEDAQEELLTLESSFSGWPKVVSSVETTLSTNIVTRDGAPLSFADAVGVTQEVTDKYEEQSAGACRAMKNKFSAMEAGTAGQIPLSELQKAAEDGRVSFSDTEFYLNEVGALDETEPTAPSVLLPNYIYSATNCLGTTSFYDVCCPNECDLILEHLEKGIMAPEASPAQVSAVLASLPADDGLPSGSLSPLVFRQLDEVAQADGGSISIHGHKFAAWLHQSFPRECPRMRAEEFTHGSSGEVLGIEEQEDEVAEATSEVNIETTKSNKTEANTSVEGESFDLSEALPLGIWGVPVAGLGGGFDAASFAQTEMSLAHEEV